MSPSGCPLYFLPLPSKQPESATGITPLVINFRLALLMILHWTPNLSFGNHTRPAALTNSWAGQMFATRRKAAVSLCNRCGWTRDDAHAVRAHRGEWTRFLSGTPCFVKTLASLNCTCEWNGSFQVTCSREEAAIYFSTCNAAKRQSWSWSGQDTTKR